MLSCLILLTEHHNHIRRLKWLAVNNLTKCTLHKEFLLYLTNYINENQIDQTKLSCSTSTVTVYRQEFKSPYLLYTLDLPIHLFLKILA